MYEDGYISESQYEKSVAEKITIMPKKETTTNDYAETYILKCATEALMKQQGFEIKTTFSSDSELSLIHILNNRRINMEFLLTKIKENLNEQMLLLTISNPRKAEEVKKYNIRPILVKDKLVFQSAAYTKTQVFHKNLSKSCLLYTSFRGIRITGTSTKCGRLPANLTDRDGSVTGTYHIHKERFYHIRTGSICTGR